MSLLEDLFTKYGTDKGTWGYTPAYEEHLDREGVRNVLEIGICGHRDIPNNVVGASLFVWRDYFPNAHIYGVDNDSQFIFNDQERITTALCDAYDLEAMKRALVDWPRVDFICDDAVHEPLSQLQLFTMLWPTLCPQGVYAIEESCPYKCPGGLLLPMVQIILGLAPDAKITEYQTHKDERLLIIRKP